MYENDLNRLLYGYLLPSERSLCLIIAYEITPVSKESVYDLHLNIVLLRWQYWCCSEIFKDVLYAYTSVHVLV